MNKRTIRESVGQLTIGERKIDYRIIRKNVKNVNLRVSRHGEISVSANPKTPEKFIRAFVESKSDWIGKRLDLVGIRVLLDTRSQFISGGKLKVLGQVYDLVVSESISNEIKIFEGSHKILISSRDAGDPSYVEKQYLKWLRDLADHVFAASISNMLSKMSHYHIGVPTVTIRVMRSRWGSCNARHKKICLNLRLVKASSECIDYVVMHELAHLIHANHSEAYYLLLSILMPDWKARKKKLNAETGISRW